MKKLFIGLSVLLAGYSGANAQAFEKSGKYLSVDLGAASYWHVGSALSNGAWGIYSPFVGKMGVQGEFGVHDYVGVGFVAGFGGRAGGYWGASGVLDIPVGVLANCHFYQIIADKTGKNIHADKLDIYAGLNVGSGLGVVFGGGTSEAAALVFFGPQVGIRYFFVPNIAVNGEVGYGKSIVQAGITFKL